MADKVGKPFTKGTSGNPGGRRRDADAELRLWIPECDREAMVRAQVSIAKGLKPKGAKFAVKAGDCTKAYIALTNRLYGMPKQSIDLTGDIATDAHPTIDLSQIPIERRRELLAAAVELGALEAAGVEPTEH